jgi:hypothetical protein
MRRVYVPPMKSAPYSRMTRRSGSERRTCGRRWLSAKRAWLRTEFGLRPKTRAPAASNSFHASRNAQASRVQIVVSSAG